MGMSWLRTCFAAAAALLVAGTASAQTPGGTLVYLVQPEPPSLANYISTSGANRLRGAKGLRRAF